MRPLSPTGAGILMMICAVFIFALMDAQAKALTARYEVMQIVWARYAGMMAVVLIVLAPRVGPLLRTRHFGLQLMRSGFLFAATFCFFTALSYMPVAAATAVMNIHPVLLTLGAAVFLREALGPRRIFGIAAALLGALIVIRPGADVFSPAALLPLLAGFCYACYALATRFLGRDEPILTSFIYTGLVGTLAASVLVPAVWITPGPADALRFLGLGAAGALGQFLLIRSLSVAEAGAIAPFGYCGIPFSAMTGLIFFGEVPDIWTGVGALVIGGAGVYVWHRETRAAVTAPPSLPDR